jgi:hypothetical protein
MKGIRDAAEKNVIISNSLKNGLFEENKLVFAKGITCAEKTSMVLKKFLPAGKSIPAGSTNGKTGRYV